MINKLSRATDIDKAWVEGGGFVGKEVAAATKKHDL